MKVSFTFLSFHTINKNNFTFRLVTNTFALRLQKLNGYEIVIICDDSGSMNTELSKYSSFSIYVIDFIFLISR